MSALLYSRRSYSLLHCVFDPYIAPQEQFEASLLQRDEASSELLAHPDAGGLHVREAQLEAAVCAGARHRYDMKRAKQRERRSRVDERRREYERWQQGPLPPEQEDHDACSASAVTSRSMSTSPHTRRSTASDAGRKRLSRLELWRQSDLIIIQNEDGGAGGADAAGPDSMSAPSDFVAPTVSRTGSAAGRTYSAGIDRLCKIGCVSTALTSKAACA